jgi:hypothetical protein
MRYPVFMAVLLFAACQKKQEPVMDMPLAGELFAGVKESLDLSRIETVTERGITIHLAKFKRNPDRIYATSEMGDVLFTRHIIDEKTATVEVQKGHDIATIHIQDGKKKITSRTADLYHGGTGFCQRETGEAFSTCFKAETDEFCTSFISCLALATQPSVSIVIALACSCSCNCKSLQP